MSRLYQPRLRLPRQPTRRSLPVAGLGGPAPARSPLFWGPSAPRAAACLPAAKQGRRRRRLAPRSLSAPGSGGGELAAAACRSRSEGRACREGERGGDLTRGRARPAGARRTTGGKASAGRQVRLCHPRAHTRTEQRSTRKRRVRRSGLGWLLPQQVCRMTDRCSCTAAADEAGARATAAPPGWPRQAIVTADSTSGGQCVLPAP
eukprot:scaffold1439_cov404-Prasinococcus_capsulatus_cf.AAC.46